MTEGKKCPGCGGVLVFEDHSLVGGPVEYWACLSCGEEMVMFGGVQGREDD